MTRLARATGVFFVVSGLAVQGVTIENPSRWTRYLPELGLVAFVTGLLLIHFIKPQILSR